MATNFISIVFYRSTHPQTEHLKNTLSNSQFLKIFSSDDIEEIQQIVNMSERTIIASDHEKILALNIKEGKAPGRGRYRKYLLDWEPPKDERVKLSLGENGLLTIKTDEILYPIEKFELFLFGCINVYNKKASGSTFSQNPSGNYFFTHFSYINHEWKAMISTHEREKNISHSLGKDWEALVKDVLTHTARYRRATEEVLTKPYFQVIYPHFQEGELKHMTIAHLVYNSQINENLTTFYKFLEKLKNSST